MPITFQVQSHEAGLRPDRFLRGRHPALSRNEALALLKSGVLSTQAGQARLRTELKSGEHLIVDKGAGIWASPIPVVFAGEGYWVFDKPAGLPVHTGTGFENAGETLQGILEAVVHPLAPLGAASALSLIGRLDRLTSGLVLVAQDPEKKRRLCTWHSYQGRFRGKETGSPP
jgi:23S rRNA-/tRNA-specific pseudouridylate synthase